MLPLLQDNLLNSSSTTPDWSVISQGEANANDDLTLYPESDGKPMAENTEQYHWIVIIKENLEILFANAPQVFIAADLLWYPVQVQRNSPEVVVEALSVRSQAPDVMVIFDRPKGKRGSYRQWQEENIPPQVVFEILSPSNVTPQGMQEMQAKFNFYQTHGVEEYYIYDPEIYELKGWLRQGQQLEPISGLSDWISPRLGIRFQVRSNQDLEIYYPNGRKFLTSLELATQADLAQQQAEQMEGQLQEAVVRLLQGGMPKAQVAQVMGLYRSAG